jgi:hypothetical protein
MVSFWKSQTFGKSLIRRILNFPNAVLSNTTFRSIFVSLDGVFCAEEIQRLGPMDFKSYSLERNPCCDSTVEKVSRISPKIISVTSFSGFIDILSRGLMHEYTCALIL